VEGENGEWRIEDRKSDGGRDPFGFAQGRFKWRKILQNCAKSCLTEGLDAICCRPAEMRIPQTRDVLLFGSRASRFYQFADRIGFCRVPENVLLRPAFAGLRRIKRRALIFDSLILDFVITTEFIEIQKVK
jgi:hypothetical protein